MAGTVSGLYEHHPASVEDIHVEALKLSALSDKAFDLHAKTGTAYQQAPANWDGVCAPELRAAPEPVRRDAMQASGALTWAAVALEYWKTQVASFNAEVDRINQASQDLQATLAKNTRSPDAGQIASITSFANQYQVAYHTYIDQGGRDTAGMFRDGPTEQNLKLVGTVILQFTGREPYQTVSPAMLYFSSRWEAAEEATDLAKKMLDPNSHWTHDDLVRLQELLAQYSQDPIFAYQLLHDLGPQGLLDLTGTLAVLQYDPPGGTPNQDQADLVGAIQLNLALALATATTKRGYTGGDGKYVPDEYELSYSWIADLMTAGRSKISLQPYPGGPSDQVYGYQLLGVLLQRGDYDPAFLSLVGGDMVDFEMEHGGSVVWRETTNPNLRLNWIGGHEGAVPSGIDPMNGLLEALSRDPEAAKQLFTNSYTLDATGHRELPRLDYLLTDRLWFDDLLVGTGDYKAHPEWFDTTNDDGRGQKYFADRGLDMLGEILETATTQNPDDRSHQIVESIIYEFGTDEQALGYNNDPSGRGQQVGPKAQEFMEHDIIPPAMRDSLANITSYYIDDIHWNLGYKATTGIDESIPATYDVRIKDVRLVEIFLADLGKDEHAREQIAQAEKSYSAVLYDFYLSGKGGQGSLHDRIVAANGEVGDAAGLIFASLDYGYTSGKADDHFVRDEKYNDQLASQYNAGKTALEFFKAGAAIPKSGAIALVTDPVGEMISQTLDKWQEDQKQYSGGQASYETGQILTQRRMEVTAMAEAAVYNSLSAEEIAQISPNMLDKDGNPKPIASWSPQDWAEWGDYLTTNGATTADFAGDTAREKYNNAYTQVDQDLGKVWPKPKS
jgi:hypothetical protein